MAAGASPGARTNTGANLSLLAVVPPGLSRYVSSTTIFFKNKNKKTITRSSNLPPPAGQLQSLSLTHTQPRHPHSQVAPPQTTPSRLPVLVLGALPLEGCKQPLIPLPVRLLQCPILSQPSHGHRRVDGHITSLRLAVVTAGCGYGG